MTLFATGQRFGDGEAGKTTALLIGVRAGADRSERVCVAG